MGADMQAAELEKGRHHPQRGRPDQFFESKDKEHLRWALRASSRRVLRGVITLSAISQTSPRTSPRKSFSSTSRQPVAAITTGASLPAFAGWAQQRYRIVDFERKIGVPGARFAIEYDPNRTARIALLNYVDGEKRYILAPDGLKVGDTILSSRNADIKPGNSLPLRAIPLGTSIHNLELKKGKGANSADRRGCSSAHGERGRLGTGSLASGEVRQVHLDCRATVVRCRTPITRTSRW